MSDAAMPPVPDRTVETLDELKRVFRLNSYSAVLKRAIVLARILAREAKDDHSIVIERRDGTQVRLLLDA